jgi:prophage tail gpP-like protein
MAERDDVALVVDGRIYAGWKSSSVSVAMDAAAGTFALEVFDRWDETSQPWAIEPGAECEIRIGSDVVISGYVDLVRPSFDANAHGIQVQGRDKSGDLVDCSAVHSPDEWKSIALDALATKLAAPFGVKVKAEADVGAPLTLVKLQHGETVLEAISRHAQMRKLLVMPDGAGGIVLTRTGTRRATVELVQGKNILSASGKLDWSERFSDYIVKGQSGFSDETDGETEAHAEGSAKDAGMTRYRPLLVTCTGEATNATAKERATWEANTRLGKSAECSVSVQGWRQSPGGPLWRPNTLVTVRAPWIALEGEMLIRSVTFDKGSSGTTTQLELVSPQAYEPEPPDGKQKKKPKKKKGAGASWGAALAEDADE